MSKHHRRRLPLHEGAQRAAARLHQRGHQAPTLIVEAYTEHADGTRTYHQAPPPPPHECKRPAFCYTCAIASILCEE